MMSHVLAADRYMFSGSHFLIIAISPFSGVQSDTKALAVETGFIDMCILDSRDLKDGEYRPTPTPKLFANLNNHMRWFLKLNGCQPPVHPFWHDCLR